MTFSSPIVGGHLTFERVRQPSQKGHTELLGSSEWIFKGWDAAMWIQSQAQHTCAFSLQLTFSFCLPQAGFEEAHCIWIGANAGSLVLKRMGHQQNKTADLS